MPKFFNGSSHGRNATAPYLYAPRVTNHRENAMGTYGARELASRPAS